MVVDMAVLQLAIHDQDSLELRFQHYCLQEETAREAKVVHCGD